ncbi:aminotransferase, class I/II [Ostertagia ostertagi]
MSKPHGAICIDDFMHRQLEDRTNILECAWQERHDKSNESDEQSDEPEAAKIPKRSDFTLEDEKVRDIYGKVTDRAPNEFEHLSRFSKLSVYFSWIVLLVFAYIREALRKWGLENDKASKELDKQKDFAPLFADFESVYSRNCYVRVRDVFERPIGSVPGATVNLIDRTSDDCNWTYKYPGTKTNVINVSSYNYLGFAQASGPCADAAVAQIDKEGLATCTTVHERGNDDIRQAVDAKKTQPIDRFPPCQKIETLVSARGRSTSQYELEKLVAEFLRVEDAIVFSMGFATNSMNAPCLVDKHSLIVSDQHNHASLILGCRLSGASTKVFAHNDMNSLEKILRDAIAYGNPKTHRPYKKILIIVEGIYSMEGSICNLPGVIALKKKYGAYLYLDEAHSIDMNSLEKILRDAIAYGNPKTHRPYKKILIIVEGIYSMEGSICNLPGVIALKKKYGAYLYLDEAHSIGAMGSTGRGVVEYWGCNPMDVDILMGTFHEKLRRCRRIHCGFKVPHDEIVLFTNEFFQRTIDHLRVNSPTGYYSCPMAPPVAQQIYTSMSIIMGKDGTNDGTVRIALGFGLLAYIL